MSKASEGESVTTAQKLGSIVKSALGGRCKD